MLLAVFTNEADIKSQVHRPAHDVTPSTDRREVLRLMRSRDEPGRAASLPTDQLCVDLSADPGAMLARPIFRKPAARVSLMLHRFSRSTMRYKHGDKGVEVVVDVGLGWCCGRVVDLGT